MVPNYVIPDHEREADYLFAGEIRLTMGQVNLTEQGFIGQVLHELGH